MTTQTPQSYFESAQSFGKPYRISYILPEVFAITICELNKARRESVYAKMSARIMDKFGVACGFSGDKTSGLVMTYNTNQVSHELAQKCSTDIWQQFCI